jgi:hypothetical protein
MGRRNEPCPNVAELREMHAQGFVPHQIAMHMGKSRKAVVRWLGEIGVEQPAPRKLRPRGVTPRFVGFALASSDKRRLVTSLYTSWNNMKIRCKTKWPGFYRWYGSKGITWCAEWNDFATFRKWALANGYRKGLTLDRIDSTKNYGPDNCRWATREEQTYNLPCVHKLTLNGVTKLLPIWAKELGVTPDLLRSRRSNGWTDEQILTTPKLTSGHFREGVQHKPRGRRSVSG